MRIDDLAVLRAVAAAGSLTQAARTLRRSQSGLTRQIQRLEAAFGVALLDRGPGGVRLTAAGEVVMDFAIGTLVALEGVHAQVRERPSAPTTMLRIAASTVPGEHLVPRLVGDFLQRHPELRARVTIADSTAVISAVLERRADVGFIGRLADDARLVEVPFAADEVVLAVPVDHPIAVHPTISPHALRGERLLTREAGSGTQRTFEEALTAAGISLDQTIDTVSLGSTQAVMSAVDAGLGIGVVSIRALQEHRPGRVVAARIAGLSIKRTLWLVYERQRPRPPSHAAFVAFSGQDPRALPG